MRLLSVFSASFDRNLFFSTSVAAALILLAILAWAVNRQAAAFASALAILPVAAVWPLSQGPHSFFIARYLLPTIAAWALLAGIGLSRVGLRLAAASVLTVAILAAGDQQVIRARGAHNWASYPVGQGAFSYLDYAGAAVIIARHARAGDGIVYRGGAATAWLMIPPGLEYYLGQGLRAGAPVPRATGRPDRPAVEPGQPGRLRQAGFLPGQRFPGLGRCQR